MRKNYLVQVSQAEHMRKKRVELVQKKLYKDVRTRRHDGHRRAQVAVERPSQLVFVRTHLLKYEEE